jgi:hypothetical protein
MSPPDEDTPPLAAARLCKFTMPCRSRMQGKLGHGCCRTNPAWIDRQTARQKNVGGCEGRLVCSLLSIQDDCLIILCLRVQSRQAGRQAGSQTDRQDHVGVLSRQTGLGPQLGALPDLPFVVAARDAPGCLSKS